MPRVLLDDESPVSFKALDDHIEVKLALLLPVDHSIVLNFDSILSLGEMKLDNDEENGSKPLFMDSGELRLVLGYEKFLSFWFLICVLLKDCSFFFMGVIISQ